MSLKSLTNQTLKLILLKKMCRYRVLRRGTHHSKTLTNECNNSQQLECEADNTESKQVTFRNKLLSGPNLKDFFKNENLAENWQDPPPLETDLIPPYLDNRLLLGAGRKVYFEVYGCQMNVNDTEVIWSILKKQNYDRTSDINEADVIFLVTCAIREGAEEKVWNKLNSLKGLRKNRKHDRPSLKIGIVGCMAERLKEKVLEKDKSVDLVVGPDAYRDLPRLLALTDSGQKSVNVMLSMDETYADIMPVRLNENSVTAYVSIMRGCDNMCTYCIVPWTRGRERSRPVSSILREVEALAEQGVKEITLLGQNVNSYRDLNEGTTNIVTAQPTSMSRGFKTVYKPKVGGLRFAQLLDKVARVDPEMRIRFTSPHPKDFPDEVLELIKEHPNICNSLHLPVQSGNTNVLERMRRGYSREAYLNLIDHVRNILPGVGISSDFICGFCGETEDEFNDTLTLMDIVKYNTAYMFAYSMREKTTAHRRYEDNVPVNVKKERLEKMIKMYRYHAEKLNRAQIGQTQLIMIEGTSKRSVHNLVGRNEQNIKVIIPGDRDEVPVKEDEGTARPLKIGDYVAVYINHANSQVLKGIPLYRTGLVDFYQNSYNTQKYMYINSI